MEIELTKRIKALTHHYRPKLHTEKTNHPVGG